MYVNINYCGLLEVNELYLSLILIKNILITFFVLIFIIILLYIINISYYYFFRNKPRSKFNEDDRPLSVIERWIFVGLLGFYLYVKYYKWYDYIFNFNRRMRRRKRRRQREKKRREEYKEILIKDVRKQRTTSLTRKEYYDIYMVGVALGVGTIALIKFLLGGG